jgi:hypothetical protein
MNAEHFVRLVEEMVDLKLQKYAAEHLKPPTPEFTRLLEMKKETDRRRLEQIRVDLVRGLQEG